MNPRSFIKHDSLLFSVSQFAVRVHYDLVVFRSHASNMGVLLKIIVFFGVQIKPKPDAIHPFCKP